MSAMTASPDSGGVRPLTVIQWVLTGFLGVAATGFFRHAFWLSGAVAIVLALLFCPPVWRRLMPSTKADLRMIIAPTLGAVGGLALLVGVSEHEKSQRQSEYLERRTAVIARAQRSFEQGQGERLEALVTRYEFVATPELDRIETQWAERSQQQSRQSNTTTEQPPSMERQINGIVDEVMEQRRQEAQ